MSSVPELQQKLFKRMGLEAPEPKQQSKGFQGVRRSSQPASRKDQRRAQREQKKTNRYSKVAQPERRQTQTQPRAQRRIQQSEPKPVVKQTKSKRPLNEEGSEEDDDDDAIGEDDEEEMSLGEHEDESDEDEDEDEEGDEEDDEDEEEIGMEDAPTYGKKGLSRAVQERLAEDDAEIEALERKLGIKKGRKSLPQSFKDDGLDGLLGDLDGGDDESEDEVEESNKRKSEYDDWLASKRRKTAQPRTSRSKAGMDDDSDGGFDDEDMDEDGDLGMDDDGESFDGFDSDTGDAPAQPRQKENPYVAPTAGVFVAKYVPPSLRKSAGLESETRARLVKQVQGLINRLTDGNILSIVQSVEELYQKNARGEVTEVLTDAILAQISKPESLPDQFFVLTGGFAAAVYRVIGSSLGSHMIRRVVTDFGAHYDSASANVSDESAIPKEASNLLTFLSQLYVFEVVSCKIIFDYMERMLNDLNEINVELLLRICRMAGRLLRRDDPQAIKHVASVLNKSVAKSGHANVSVRTKFMIETITDLKNSKPKGRGLESAVVSEHVQRMKKRLGELKSQSRRLDGLAPMGIGLEDVENADTRGKWWLVGASVPAKPEGSKKFTKEESQEETYESSDNEDMDFVLPDYPKKARAQGFSNVAQISIFTALMSANSYEHGFRQFMNLRLRKDEQLEIARVLVQCVGSEAQYNPYYALVGKQACANSRIKFALQDRLWKIFRGLGESLFGEEPEDEDTADGERMKDGRRISNVAHFYASLITEGALTIAILKPLDLPHVNVWTLQFVEWLLIALLRECRGKGQEEDVKVAKWFGPARDMPVLAAGVHWALRKKVRKTKLISAKETKKLGSAREKAQALVQAVASTEG